MSEINEIKKLIEDESNAECYSIFDETELTIINDENTEVEKNVKTSPFEGLTIDEITFSSMDNAKAKAKLIEENVAAIRKIGKFKQEEDLKREQEHQKLMAETKQIFDELFKIISEAENRTDDTDN